MTTREDLDGLIQTVADASGDASLQIALGTPGTEIQHPVTKEVRSTGAAFASPGFLDTLLTGVAELFDERTASWVVVTTNATGVNPVIAAGNGVSGVSKNESLNTIQVTWTQAFTGTTYLAWAILEVDVDWTYRLRAKLAASLTVRFGDAAGGLLGINDRTVLVAAIGPRV